MTSTSTKVGHFLARILGIQLQEPQNLLIEDFHRGSTQFAVDENTFTEDVPTTAEFLESLVPSRDNALAYFKSLFPCINWLPAYNLHWLAGDVVSGWLHPLRGDVYAFILTLLSSATLGVTIGAIVVPQGMAYALLANLDPQYGLYSAFIGPVLYWLFATSKDITIGVCNLKVPTTEQHFGLI